MDRLGVGDLRSTDDGRNIQVAFPGRRRTDADGFVSQPDMLEVAVRLGVDGDGLDAEFAAGTQNTQGDFAPIGNQDFTDHV